MTKLNLLLFLFFVHTLSGFAQIRTQNVASVIERVTVFYSGAQVTRTASTFLNAGKTELVFKSLTSTIDPNSVQVKGEGDFTISSVAHQLNYLEEQTKKDTIILLERQSKDLKDKMTLQENMLNVLAQEKSLLQHNQVQMVGVQNSAAKTADLKEMADYQRTRLTEVLQREFEVNKELAMLKETVIKVTAQMNELNYKKTVITSELHVTVVATSEGTARFTFNYFTAQAGWAATYDLRVTDIEHPIALQMKANVFQNSLEDWKEVKLSLSTANPQESGVKPTMYPWMLGYVNPQRFSKSHTGGHYSTIRRIPGTNKITGTIVDESGEVMIGASILVKGTTAGTVTDMDGHFELTLPIANNNMIVVSFVGYEPKEVALNSNSDINFQFNGGGALNEVVVTGYGSSRNKSSVDIKDPELQDKIKESKAVVYSERQAPTATAYDIELPYTIPSDSKQYMVEVKVVNMPATYQYYVAPKLNKDVFLTARVVQWEQYNLQSGNVNLYFEGAYSAKTYLDVQNLTDTLDISLGKDKNIVVTRTKQKDFTKTGFLNGKRQITTAWEIALRNKRQQPIHVVVEDQIPVATMKEIEVESQIKGSEYEEKTGRLLWKLDLTASEERKLNFQYTVKYPKGERVQLE